MKFWKTSQNQEESESRKIEDFKRENPFVRLIFAASAPHFRNTMNDRDKLDVVFGVCLQMSLTGDLSVDKEYTYVHICTYISARLFSLEGNERYRLRRGRRIIKLAFFVEISARRDVNRISHVPVNLDSYQISDYEIVFLPASILASRSIYVLTKMTKRISPLFFFF